MRLTKRGWHFLQSREITSYPIELKERMLPIHLLNLERYIQYPYYIHTLTHISVFDEVTAVMLALNSNNLGKYLKDLKENQ